MGTVIAVRVPADRPVGDFVYADLTDASAVYCIADGVTTLTFDQDLPVEVTDAVRRRLVVADEGRPMRTDLEDAVAAGTVWLADHPDETDAAALALRVAVATARMVLGPDPTVTTSTPPPAASEQEQP